MPEPAATVLAIPELLEAILLQLPPRDLLLAQRVNKSFSEAIQASTHIQKKLFFIAPSTTDGEPALLNPFVGRLAHVCSGGPYPYVDRMREIDGLSFPEEADISSEFVDIRDSPFSIESNDAVDIRVTPSRENKLLDGDALQQGSFRRMVITSKPCRLWISSVCLPDTRYSHMHRRKIETNSMAELTDMMNISWVDWMCPRDKWAA